MGEMVKDIERVIKEGLVVDIDGKKFSASKLEPVIDQRAFTSVEVSTLTGLVGFLQTNIDQFKIEDLLCIVEGHDQVCVKTKINDVTLKRSGIIHANLSKDGHQFPFCQFLDVEDFVIKLKSLFVESPDQSKLMLFVSKLTVQNSIEVQDDGVSQAAQVKKGISGALKDKEVAPTMVNLKPYRTFAEIEQPESSFLFRMRPGHGTGLPLCALFEADGGAWKAKAMESIMKYIKSGVDKLTIIA